MRYASLLLLVVLAACANGKTGALAPAYQSSEIVASSDVCMNVDNCPSFAPFFRPFEDQSAQPVWWLVSTGGRACVVSPQVFTRAAALYGTPVTCAWRFRRRV
jgi:hypothetical protein